MSAWDLTRRGVSKRLPPSTQPKLVGTERTQSEPVSPQPLAASYWHEQLLALIEPSASRAGAQLLLNLDTANLVQTLPLLLLADRQSLPQTSPDQSLIDSLASYCSRSLTPSPSTTSSSQSSNSAESGSELGPAPEGAGRLPLLIEAPALRADSTFCSSLSSYSSSGSSYGDLSLAANECSQLDFAHAVQAPDRKARKKDQNRRAAFNYRRKKMEERDKLLEEEARLVHRHVRLAGRIARLEEKIVTMLSSQTTKIFDSGNKPSGHLCPTCFKPCDTITALRMHLRTRHFPETMPQLERSESRAAPAAAKSKADARLVSRRDCYMKSSPKQASERARANADLGATTPLDPQSHRHKSVEAYCDSLNDLDDNDDEDAHSDDDID